MLLILTGGASPAVPIFSGSMADSSAMSRARAIWGDSAMIALKRKQGDSYWTKQVGYVQPNGVFRVVAEAPQTWDAAFGKVNQP